MARIWNYLIICMLAVATAACGDSGTFKVEGTLAGGETQSMRFVYTARDAVHTVHVGAREGKFEMTGNSPTPTIVDIIANDGRLIAQVCVTNGEKIRCTLNRRAPWEIEMEGNDTDAEWAGFIRDKAEAFRSGDDMKINAAVAAYAKAHPADLLSGILVTRTFRARGHQAEADSLLNSLDESARPSWLAEGAATLLHRQNSSSGTVAYVKYYASPDSIYTFLPEESELSLITVSDSPTGQARPDSVVKTLRQLHRDHKASRLRVFDFSVDTDTFTWRRAIRPDSAKWQQGWLPGGVLGDGLQDVDITTLPYFIVTDSAGRTLFSGPSPEEAKKFIEKRLN